MALARKLPEAKKPVSIETDFAAWCAEQAALIAAQATDRIDWANVAEEIASLGGSQRRELISRYRVICLHLLKMIHQPERETGSWEATLIEQRTQLEGLLEQSPSLKPYRDEAFARAWRLVRPRAALETDLPMGTFPETPPFTREEAERFGYYPRPAKARR